MSTDGFTRSVYPRITGPEAARDIERARDRGYAAGHAEGMRAASVAATEQRARLDAENDALRREHAREVENAVAVLREAAGALTRRHDELLAAAQSLVQRLAVELAESVVARELNDNEHAARNALHRALSIVDRDEICTVRVNPGDAEILQKLLVGEAPVPLVADDTLAAGDAVATLDNGAVDARLAAAFERARNALAEEGS